MRSAKAPASDRSLDFVRAKVAEDREADRFGRPITTRFPPEPNGYLHIGHAKAICLDFGLAREFDGVCNLRFDDTNPETEDEEYVESIQRDLKWLGFDPGDRVFYASDYYDKLYAYALQLIDAGLAYVDSVGLDELRELRGTVTEPGKPSKHRSRSKKENRALFERMRAGEFADGAHVLRAKIGLDSPNMKMRDPLLYRIRRQHHFRTGDAWPIYPMYDFAHCLSDAIEGVTHSLCTLEFENNRELYDWILKAVGTERPPEQTEFAKLSFTYTVLSKRNLRAMVEEGLVDGWDDPRMPTLSGLRRRGVPPEAIRALVDDVGVAKTNSTVDLTRFENAMRDTLNPEVPRVMAVLRPLKVTVTNWPDGEVDWIDAPLYPHDVPKQGTRKVPFSSPLFIERTDFAVDPPKGFRRLVPGGEVRLRYGYFLRCTDVVRDDETGVIIEIKGTIDPETRGGKSPADGRKVKGTIHWVSETGSESVVVRLTDRLFSSEHPGADGDWRADLNAESMVVLYGCRVEPFVAGDPPGTRYQFERQGYFASDPVDSSPDGLVYNRIVALKDSWARKKAPVAEAPAPKPKASPKSGRSKAPASKAPAPAPAAPELTAAQKKVADTLVKSHKGLSADDAALLAQSDGLRAFFEAAAKQSGDAAAAANWVTNDLRAVTKDTPLADLPFDGVALGRLIQLQAGGTVSSRSARDVFGVLVEAGGDPKAIVEDRGWAQVSDDDALEAAVQGVLDAHPDEVAEFRAGKAALKGFFVGQVMKATRGRANPGKVQALLAAALKGEG